MSLTLETSKERVELLKAGISGKHIENLYIAYNNFKIMNTPTHFGFIIVDNKQNKNDTISHSAVAELSL